MNSTPPPGSPYRTTKEAADYIRRHPITVLRLFREGKIAAERPAGSKGWHTTVAALDDYMAGREPAASLADTLKPRRTSKDVRAARKTPA